MPTWQVSEILGSLSDYILALLGVLFANIFAIGGLILGILIVRRVLVEKRSPSNVFAWFFLVLLFPPIGVPMYFLLGGRKSRRVTRIKKAVLKQARALSETTEHQRAGPSMRQIPGLEQSDIIISGNQTELLTDGVAAFERLEKEILQAQHTIHIATYILSKDTTGLRIIELLEQRAREGVTIRLLLDSLGSWNGSQTARRRIRKAGGFVHTFVPVIPIHSGVSTNLRNHRKIAIFDNQLAITGGQNLDQRFMGADDDPTRFTDFSLITHGPAVADLNHIFIADWAFASKAAPSEFKQELSTTVPAYGTQKVQILAGGPDVKNDPIWEKIIRIVQEFRNELTLITPYFVPDEVLFQTLMIKAHMGHSIRLILPLRSNQKLTDIARYHYLRQLNEAGVHILFYTPKMLHAKLLLADGKVAMTGSANLDMRSLFVNFEVAQLHYSQDDIQQLTRWADHILKDCITYQQALQTNPDLLPKRIPATLIHLLTPLL